MRERIQTIDGLRFLAAVGVLWIHTWTAHKNPRCYIGRIDLADVMAIGVNGVDLFFVISGFCMYYFYASKNNFSYRDFSRFLIKRFIRLSPAFYVASIVYILIDKICYHRQLESLLNFFHSIFYLNYLFPRFNTAAHFWTLTVEWQFYFIIPFILIYQNRHSFNNVFFFIFGLIFLISVLSVFILQKNSDDLTNTIIFRAIEFGCGVYTARLIINGNSFFENRGYWLIAFILITYWGRILVSRSILNLSTDFHNLFKVIGFTLMGVGFSGILFLSVTSVKLLRYLLGNKIFSTMGKISYSFYLLHGLVIPPVVHFVIEYLSFFNGILAPIISTFIGTIILFPISWLSYRLLERPYFQKENLTTK